MEPTLYFQVHDKITYRLKYMEWNILRTVDEDMKVNMIIIKKKYNSCELSINIFNIRLFYLKLLSDNLR